MRLPRVQFTVGRMMAGVVIIAILIECALLYKAHACLQVLCDVSRWAIGGLRSDGERMGRQPAHGLEERSARYCRESGCKGRLSPPDAGEV